MFETWREEASGEATKRRVRAARVEYRDRWYRTLLNALHLNADHQAQLRGRGLSEETVWSRRYRSLPPTGRIELCQRVLRVLAGEPVGVPGFYQHPKTKSWIFAGAAGLLVPVVNRDGLIQGLQVRRDNAGSDGNRYCWVSSSRKKGLNGSSPGAPVHVARPVGVDVYEHPDVVWITEGPLKADRIAQEKRDLVLAMPGVAVRSGVLAEIRHQGAQWAVVAFDMDQYENRQVAHHLRQLCTELVSAEVKVAVASWDKGYKGIDDALQAGICIRLRRWKTAE